ncbi:MAG TPA: hypothetical protein VM095_08805 [Pyrinomonadaceae bacterium]|nr:hypothetical protein [Pyrinomonadaceae bacterium]
MIKAFLAISILLLSSVSFTTITQKDLPPGGIKLLPGYQHKTLQGFDTWVGKIWKEGGLEIKYDIGFLAGDYADPKHRENFLWYKEQLIEGRRVHCALYKSNSLVVSFPDSSANFTAKVNSQEDIAEMLLMILTYRPVARRR